MRRWLAGVLTGSIVISMAPDVTAADARKASLTRADAGTTVRIGGKGQWKPAKAGMLLNTGDEIHTARGVAELTYGDGTVTRLGPDSTLGLRDAQTRGLRLWFGRLWLKVTKGSGGMRIQTPAAVAAVTGTDLFVFHESKHAQMGANPVVATAGSFRIADDEVKVSTIGLLDGGVHVQKLDSTFESSLLNRPGKGVWIASTGNFRMAQMDGVDLDPGQKAVADPGAQTLQILPMDPSEIANNRTVIGEVGGPGGRPAGNPPPNGPNNGNKPNNPPPPNNQGRPGNPPPPNGQNGNPPPNDGRPGPGAPNGQPGGLPPGPPPLPGPDGSNGPAGTQQPGTPPNGPDNPPPPQGPDGPNPPPAPPPPPPPPDPTQNIQDQLIRPVDRSPASGELEIIIQ